MVERCIPVPVRSVDRGLMFQEELNEWDASDGGGAVEGCLLLSGILSAWGGAVGDEEASGVEVRLRGAEVEGFL